MYIYIKKTRGQQIWGGRSFLKCRLLETLFKTPTVVLSKSAKGVKFGTFFCGNLSDGNESHVLEN